MYFFILFVFVLLLNGLDSSTSLIKPLIINKFNFANIRGQKDYQLMTEPEFIELLKQFNIKKQMRLKQEKENKIYRENLASRIKSSVLRDFHTFRYLHSMNPKTSSWNQRL